MMVPTTPRQLLHSTYEHPTITVTVRLRVNDAHSIFVRVYTEIGPASQSLLVILAYVLYRNCTYCITFIHGSRTNEWVHSQCSIYLYLYLYDVQMLIATSHPRMALMSHTVMSIQFRPRLNPCSQQAQSLVETHILHIPDLHPRMHRIRIDILQVLMVAKRVFLCYPWSVSDLMISHVRI